MTRRFSTSNCSSGEGLNIFFYSVSCWKTWSLYSLLTFVLLFFSCLQQYAKSGYHKRDMIREWEIVLFAFYCRLADWKTFRMVRLRLEKNAWIFACQIPSPLLTIQQPSHKLHSPPSFYFILSYMYSTHTSLKFFDYGSLPWLFLLCMISVDMNGPSKACVGHHSFSSSQVGEFIPLISSKHDLRANYTNKPVPTPNGSLPRKRVVYRRACLAQSLPIRSNRETM